MCKFPKFNPSSHVHQHCSLPIVEMTHSQLLEGLKCDSQTENNGKRRSRGMFPSSQHFRRVEGRVGALGWDQEELTSFNYSHKHAQNQHGVVSAQLEHFWCQDEPRATRTHKIHHGPDLGETTTFPPLQYTLQLSTGVTSKWLFVPGLPNGSPEIPIVGTPTTLEAHNLVCRLPIVMKSKAKLQPLSRTFQRYIARCLHATKSGRFLTFNGRESNCQFDSRPFFGHKLCFRCPNERCEPI